MIDQQLRRIFDPYLLKIISIFDKTNIRPNHLTLIGLCFGVACFYALFVQAYAVALALLMINRLFDGLDGVLARHQDAQGKKGTTDFGGYLDIVSDFLFYNGFVLFFAMGQPALLLPAAVLMFSFVGTGTSFLAFAIFEAKRGADKDVTKKPDTSGKWRKSFYYIGGWTEGAETILCFAVMCLFPAYFAVCAYVFSALCWVTTAMRLAEGYRVLK